MKITKKQLKQIIKEEMLHEASPASAADMDRWESDYKDDPNQLAPAAALYKQGLQKPLSRIIDKLDQAINTIESASGAVQGEAAQTLAVGLKQAEAVWDELHNLLDANRK